MQALILTRHLKAALYIIPKSEIRYYLLGAFIEVLAIETRVAVTDGHRAAVMRTVGSNEDTFSVIVPRDVVEMVASLKTETVQLSCVDGVWKLGSVEFKPVDGRFPDYRRIIPSGWSYEAAAYNPSFLMDFVKMGKALGYKGSPILRQNGGDSALVHFYTQDDFIGVVMPMRDFSEKMPDLGAPTWGSK